MTEKNMVAPLVVDSNPIWVFSTKIWVSVHVLSGFSQQEFGYKIRLGPVLVLYWPLSHCKANQLPLSLP